ncbi:MAG: alpha/beta fold hydrolase [Chloroflexi bacterium]|nr:alpha/beta fold hydrolase [Chloroflexota bacterium]
MEQPAGVWERRRRVPVPGGEVALSEIDPAGAGEQEPVVLLHKLGGWNADWRHVAPTLASGRRVLALEFAGHGDSSSTEPGGFAYPLAQSAADVLAALDRLGVERSALVGNSLGGCVATLIAADHPARVSRLGLISVALGRAVTEERARELERPGWFDGEGRPLPRDAAENARISGTLDPAIGEELNASRWRAGRWVRWSERGVALAGVFDALPRVRAPTLLLYGERDPLIAMFEEKALAALPDGRAVHVTDTGRFPHQESPAETAAALLDFLGPGGA